MAHIHRHEDHEGNLADISYFCTDWCHRQWVQERGEKYEGWDGAHEAPNGTYCEECGHHCGELATGYAEHGGQMAWTVGGFISYE